MTDSPETSSISISKPLTAEEIAAKVDLMREKMREQASEEQKNATKPAPSVQKTPEERRFESALITYDDPNSQQADIVKKDNIGWRYV